ncbi:putative membrane protein required for colicin V production [Bradyrhizobium liaoningense]
MQTRRCSRTGSGSSRSSSWWACCSAGRIALNDTVGEAGIGDRLGGAALGAIRVGLVATTLVLVFDQIVPANRQPPFLAGSHLRPLFSAAGQMGFKSLPPEAASAIDRLKQEQRI